MSWNRRTRNILWTAAVLLLVVSAAGPAYLIRQGASPPSIAESVVAPSQRGVVCFGYGDVEHGVAGLAPLQSGRVAGVLVHETDEVAAGTILLRLDDHTARWRVAEARAAFEAAQALLAQARQLPKQQQARLAQQRESVEAMRRRLLSAQHALVRKQQLLKANQLSTEEVAAAEEQVKEVEALERAAVQKLAELEVVDPAVDLRRAEAELAAAEARLGQARQALEECELKAPADGTVLRILVAPGDVLSGGPGKPAVLFCPNTPRLVRAEVEQEFAERLCVGQPAVIEDDAGAGTRWRGRVLRISDWYTQRRTVLQESPQLNDVRTVECLIAMEPDQAPLRIGQRVRVWINRPLE